MPDKDSVRIMFNEISGRYDFLNHLLSFGVDRYWRRRLVKEMLRSGPEHVLDIATGTADLAIALRKKAKVRVTGVDIAWNMVQIGNRKIRESGFAADISLLVGDAEHLEFLDSTFDAAMVAFGVRNFENLGKGLSEMKRVLKQNGKILILEFSHPHAFPLRQLYAMYSRFGIPFIGRILSLNPTAYRYLPETVAAFPAGNAFLQIMQDTGLVNCRVISLSGGIASIYSGTKPE
jgi:demethylmenaquinone methyltransferase/2-methoxy-6-polyprenyl-1,4-benzoquinol methylase